MENNLNKIEEQIKKKPWEFALHQALFILESLNKNKSEFGCGKNPNDEPAVLNAYCNFSTPSSDCIEYKMKNNSNHLTLNQTSLIGANGIMPQQYTEKILNKMKEKDNSILDFINIFNQRSFGLLHKLEKKTKINLNTNYYNTNFIASIAGLKTNSKWQKILESFTSNIWQKNKNSSSLLSILQTIFPFDMQIEQFVKQWIEVNENNKTYLNSDKLSNKILGNKALCKHMAIKLIINIDNIHDYEKLLPKGENRKLIEAICKYYVTPGLRIKFKINLNNNKDKISTLNKNKKLGYNVWAQYH